MKELLPIYRNTKIIPGAGPLKIPGTMFLIKAGEEVILIDPFALPQSEIEQLEALGVPTLILITGENHARDAEAYRKRYGAKILAHRQAAPELGIAVDDVFGDGETLPGGLRTLGMPGCTAGETIFRQDQRGGVLIVGDALYNLQLEECGLILGSIMLFASITGLADPPGRLNIMPKFFMRDEKRAAESYQKLLEHDFEQILVSHGSPILSGAKEMLQSALENWISSMTR